MGDALQAVSFSTVLLALVSGLVGALVSTAVYVRRENRQFKIETLKHFAANRYDVHGDEFSRALNEILVVFNNDRDVMRRLQEFHDMVTTRSGNAEDALIRLYKSMCKAVDVKFDTFNDSFFLKPFNTRGGITTVSGGGSTP